MLKLSEWLKEGAVMSIGSNRFLVAYGKRSWLMHPDPPPASSFYFPD